MKQRKALALDRTPMIKYDEPASLKDLNTTPEFLTKKLFKVLCPKCNRDMQERKGKYGYFYGCILYPMCNGKRKIRK
jgi:ssDNA-binding Zn-finger/Zn-ribbon topoisomerase 1